MRNWFIYITIIISCIFSLSGKTTVAQENIEPQLTVFQDTNIIRLGEQATLSIKIIANAADTVVLPHFKDTITQHIEIAEVQQPDTAFDDENITLKTITQTIKITSFDSGVWVIPPVNVVVNNDTLLSEPSMLIVQTVDVDTTQAIKPIVAPYSVSLTFTEWLKLYWHWVALAVLIIVAIAALIYYLKNKPKNIEQVEPEPEIPLSEQIWTKINHLEQQKLWQQGQYKAYYSEISEILRLLLEKIYHFNALERTTDEIVQHLKYQGVSNEQITKIKHILTVSDLAKYAKEQPLATENELALQQLKEITGNLLQEHEQTENKPQED